MHHLLRKQIALLVIGLLLGFSGLAQFGFMKQINRENHDDKPYYFGLTLGAAHTYLKATKTPRFLEYDSVLTIEPGFSPAFTLGLLATLHPFNRWELRANPQLLLGVSRSFKYILRNPQPGEAEIEIRKVQSTVVSLPLSVKFNSDRINNFRVYMLAGGQVDKDLASNASALNSENLLKLKKTDFGVHAGLGFNLYLPFVTVTPEIKFVYGMANLHSPTPALKFSNTIDKLQSRMVVFSLHLEE